MRTRVAALATTTLLATLLTLPAFAAGKLARPPAVPPAEPILTHAEWQEATALDRETLGDTEAAVEQTFTALETAEGKLSPQVQQHYRAMRETMYRNLREVLAKCADARARLYRARTQRAVEEARGGAIAALVHLKTVTENNSALLKIVMERAEEVPRAPR